MKVTLIIHKLILLENIEINEGKNPLNATTMTTYRNPVPS